MMRAIFIVLFIVYGQSIHAQMTCFQAFQTVEERYLDAVRLHLNGDSNRSARAVSEVLKGKEISQMLNQPSSPFHSQLMSLNTVQILVKS